MAGRTCARESCANPVTGRKDAKYCTDACRALASKERRQSRNKAQRRGAGGRSSVLTSAFTRSIRKVERTPADAAAVALARVYARRIDEGFDLSKLGPQLLAVLDHLRMTPRSREARKDDAALSADNAARLEVTLGALKELGRLENVDAARVQMLRSIARALDADPGNAALWRQYREALEELTADDSSGSLDDEIEDLFTDVGDTPAS
jgi:hypothetical protein